MAKAHDPYQESLYQKELNSVATKVFYSTKRGYPEYKLIEKKVIERQPRPAMKPNKRWRKR